MEQINLLDEVAAMRAELASLRAEVARLKTAEVAEVTEFSAVANLADSAEDGISNCVR